MKKLLLTALLVTACMPTPEDINSSDIDGYVSDAGHLSVAEEQPKTEVTCDLECLPPEQDGDNLCSYRKFNQTSRYDQFVALQPNSATLWPGNVVSGRGASLGLLTPLGLRLAPVTFSISLEGMRGKVGGTLNEPNLLTFRQLRNDILNEGVKGSTPAAIDLQINEVHSLSQVGVKLGAGVSWPGGGKVAGSFDFSSTNKKTKVLVDFTQAYYTIDINAPLRPSDFFLKAVRSEDVQKVVQKGNPPVYIQSITYGRRVIFAVESDKSSQDIEVAIKAAYNAKAADGDVTVDVNTKKTLDESSIHAFILGGSGEDAVGAVAGFEGVVEYIKNGGNYSKESPGAPISYKLAYLDNEVTQLAFTTDYAEKTCTRNRGDLKFNLESVTQTGGGSIKLYGVISILVPTGDNDMVACGGGEQIDIFSLTQNQYQVIPKGGTWRPSLPMEETVPNARLGKGTEICVMGNLWNSHMDEWFPPEDEPFVDVTKTFYYENSWNGLRTVHFNGNGDLGIDVTFKVSELE
jgi:thiol-activated cytolysin